MAVDLNLARPIVAGGTGATNSFDALRNLNGELAGDQVDNYDIHSWQNGSFYSLATATAPPVANHAFVGTVLVYDPDHMVIEARDLNDGSSPGTLWVRQMNNGLWGLWDNAATAGNEGQPSQISDYFLGTRDIGNQLPILVYNGDSLTSGGVGGIPSWTGSVTAPPWLGNAGQPFGAINVSVGGQDVLALIENSYLHVNPLFRNYSGKNLLLIWIGTNNIAGSQPPDQVYSYIRAHCLHMRKLGWEVGVATMISRDSWDSAKNVLNNYIYAGWATFADYLFDYASCPHLGPDGSYADPTYFLDGTHLTGAGNAEIAAKCQSVLDDIMAKPRHFAPSTQIVCDRSFYASGAPALSVSRGQHGDTAAIHPTLIIDTDAPQWVPAQLYSAAVLGCGLRLESTLGNHTIFMAGAGYGDGSPRLVFYDGSVGEVMSLGRTTAKITGSLTVLDDGNWYPITVTSTSNTGAGVKLAASPGSFTIFSGGTTFGKRLVFWDDAVGERLAIASDGTLAAAGAITAGGAITASTITASGAVNAASANVSGALGVGTINATGAIKTAGGVTVSSTVFFQSDNSMYIQYSGNKFNFTAPINAPAITGLDAPVSANDVVTKGYVDDLLDALRARVEALEAA